MIFNNIDFDTYLQKYPNDDGFFGPYGGRYISDDLKAAMEEITDAYFSICQSPASRASVSQRSISAISFSSSRSFSSYSAAYFS